MDKEPHIKGGNKSNMKTKNIFRKINYLVIIIVLTIWSYNQCQGNKTFRAEYLKSNYKGIISKIIKIEGNHDMPTYIFTNDSSHLLQVNEGYLQRIVKPDDSLIKRAGYDTVEVYRRDFNSTYKKIYP
jgi:hypothetical protein